MEYLLGGKLGSSLVPSYLPVSDSEKTPRIYRDKVSEPKRFLSQSPYRIIDADSAVTDWIFLVSYDKAGGNVIVGMFEHLYALNLRTNRLLDLDTPNFLFTATSVMGKQLIGAGRSNVEAELAKVMLYQTTPAEIRTDSTLRANSKVPVVARSLEQNFNNCFVVGFSNGCVEFFDSRMSRSTMSIIAHDDLLCGLAVSSKGLEFATGSKDRSVKIWDARIFSRRDAVNAATSELRTEETVKAISWHPTDASLVAIGGGIGDNNVTLYNTHSKTTVSTYATRSQVSGLEWLTNDTFALGHGERGDNILSICKFYPRDSSIVAPFVAPKQHHSLNVLSMVRGQEGEEKLDLMLHCNTESLHFFNVSTALNPPKVRKEKESRPSVFDSRPSLR